ncbi:unnamed protein product [Paramecium sonneborni]|uniref:Ubiquitin-like domain-containing protein n=1 Tax=Paramecium sonneborni TaxID=65129 RepID=A0A8S1RJG3_9CILI|nr:unnamed protein product [Paramecium sonneborni]
MNQTLTLIIQHTEKGKMYNIEVSADSLVSELVAEFTELLNAGQQIVSFVYNGKTLDANKSFKEQAVVKGARLDLILKHHGGRK